MGALRAYRRPHIARGANSSITSASLAALGTGASLDGTVVSQQHLVLHVIGTSLVLLDAGLLLLAVTLDGIRRLAFALQVILVVRL